MGTLIHAPAHGLVADDTIMLGNLVGGDGLSENTVYYVLAAGLTADDFAVSESSGGAAVTYTTDITDGVIVRTDTYDQVADGVMDAPTVLSAPTDLALSSTVLTTPDGHKTIRLDVSLTQPTLPTLRHSIVTITGPSGDPFQVVIPVGQTTGMVQGAVGNTAYSAVAHAYDVYGNVSAATSTVNHTTTYDTSAPATPTGLTIVGGIKNVTIGWTGVSDTDLDHYDVAVSTNGGSTFPTVYSSKTTVVAITELTVGTTYTVKVRAVDRSGNASAYSSTVAAAPRAATGSGTGGTDIAALSINSGDITALAITAAKIAAGAVVAEKIAVGSINPSQFMGDGTNLVPNPSFEFLGTAGAALSTDNLGALLPGWDSLPTKTELRNSPTAHGGANHLRFTAAGGSQVVAVGSKFPITAGRKYTVSVWMSGASANVGTAATGMNVRFYDASGAQLSNNATIAQTNLGTGTTWTKYTGTVTADATAAYCAVVPYSGSGATAGDVSLVDDIEVYASDHDVNHAGGNVVIDSTGITIINGALSFTDAYGTTAMDGYGFGPSWMRFITRLLYNSDFVAGSTSDIAVGETGSGSGSDNYKASINSNLPGWVVAASDGTVKIVSDATATQGKALTFIQNGASQTNRVYQDFPIEPGKVPYVIYSWRRTITGATDFALNIYGSYRDSDHAIIGSRVGGGVTYSTSQSTYIKDTSSSTLMAGVVAPTNAVYFRFEIEVVHNAYTAGTKLSQVWFSDVEAHSYNGAWPSALGYAAGNNTFDFSGSALALNTVSGGNGGAVAVPIIVPALTEVAQYKLWCTDTASARNAEARLYKDTGSSTLQFVPGSDATFSFTPSAASAQTAFPSSSAFVLEPGMYWLVIRNTNTSRAFDIGGTTNSASNLATNSLSTTSTAALGSTIDISGWSASGRVIGAVVKGYVFSGSVI